MTQTTIELGDFLTNGKRWGKLDSVHSMTLGERSGLFAYVVNEAEGWADYWHDDDIVNWVPAVFGIPVQDEIAEAYERAINADVLINEETPARIVDVYPAGERVRIAYRVGNILRREWVSVYALMNENAPAEASA